ncbi:MAG: hypothetical protein WC809_19920 [Sinimarinibacterium sp.]
MNQGLLFSSSSILLAAVFGVAALFAGNAESLDRPETRRDAETWTAQALGSYQRTGGHRILFEDGIASQVVGVEPQPDRDSILKVALIDRGARSLSPTHTPLLTASRSTQRSP